MNEFKLKLLLKALPVACPYYKGDEEDCGISDFFNYEEGWIHIACKCDGVIAKCDLPENMMEHAPEIL